MKKLKKKLNKIQSVFFALLIIGTTLTPYASVFAASDQTANTDIVRSLALSYKLTGSSTYTDLVSPYEITDSTLIDSFRALYSFDILDNINPDTGEPERTVHEGDYYTIDLPDKIQLSSSTGGAILGNAGRPIANYTFVQDPDLTWKVRVEFTDYVDDLNEYDIHGNMEFDFSFDLSTVVKGTTETIYIPIDDNNGINLKITVPLPPVTTPISLTKTVTSYTPLTRTLIWNVNMLPATGVFSGCTFTDTLDVTKVDLASLKHGSVNLVQDVDYTYNPATGLITYLIPDGRDGSAYQNIIITATAKRDLYGSTTPTIVNNQANLSGGSADVDIDSNSLNYTITPNWLSKSGAVIEGNKIRWTINANTTRQDMYNAVITDNLSADLVLDKTTVKLGGTVISVYDDSHTPVSDTEIYGVYILNPDSTSTLNIYLPRGVANSSNLLRTITMETSVVAPTTATTTSPSYTNTASLDANFIGDGNGVGTIATGNITTTGVNVPNVAINKGHLALTADDKRNGTITWTMTAVSNLSTYGKSQIVDTLPSDQEFLPDEIYWGSTPINTTTEPKAEISLDGRTLTITFATDEALKTIQTFTVKTRIIDSVYDQNLSRNFTNSARVAIFDDLDVELAASNDTDSINITNNVITKTSSTYTGNTSQVGENPRVNFNIVINSNLMELNGVQINDDLSQIVTQFKKSGESSFTTVNGVKWTYVADSLTITKNASHYIPDTLDLAAIADASTYIDDILNVDFGSGTLNDKYTITFTAELDVSQNDIFKENGVIRCSGNTASIEGIGLNTGIVTSTPTGNSSEISNELLGKYGVNLVAEQQAQWTINLNQHNLELTSARVVDILPLGLTLDPTNIKLYTNVIGSNGAFVTGSTVESQGVSVPFTYTYELSTEPGEEGRYVLTVDLPDNNTAYILRFNTDIDNSLLGTQINNSAYYVGEGTVLENESVTNLTISATVGGGSTTKSSITVNKYNNDNGEIINGTTFALNWLRGGDPTDPVFVRNLITADGIVLFRGLTKGETYTITEVSPTSGYIIDNPDPVVVEVPIDISGNMDPITVFNTPIKNGTWNPTALKDLSGKAFVRDFNFEILDNDTQVFSGITNNLVSDGRYDVAFTLNDGIAPEQLLTYSDDHIFSLDDEDGTEYLATTKTLVMRESNALIPGYILDDNAYQLVLKIYNVKGQADLKVVIEDEFGNVLSDDQGNFTIDNIPVFFNSYSATGDFNLDVSKTLIGHELTDGQFNFSLYEGETLLQTTSNEEGVLNEDGSYTGVVNFETLNFTQGDAGLRTYTILEENSGLDGYTYDTSVYTVELLVTDNDDGTITSTIESITKTRDNNDIIVEDINFINSYTKLDFTVSKHLTGKTMEDKEFAFLLQQVDIDNESKIGEPITGHNDETGNVTFQDITFNLDDLGNTFYFNVSEVNDNKLFYTYDATKFLISATVVQNEDGTLALEQSLFKVNDISLVAVDSIDFYNTFTPLIPQTGGKILSAMLIGTTLTLLGFLILTKTKKDKQEDY
ncbi:MAG: FctA domain-containing protein [Firmicutes bacterium]|nr:FctA domain-containing protein [Bacillota bacterium]